MIIKKFYCSTLKNQNVHANENPHISLNSQNSKISY